MAAVRITTRATGPRHGPPSRLRTQPPHRHVHCLGDGGRRARRSPAHRCEPRPGPPRGSRLALVGEAPRPRDRRRTRLPLGTGSGQHRPGRRSRWPVQVDHRRPTGSTDHEVRAGPGPRLLRVELGGPQPLATSTGGGMWASSRRWPPRRPTAPSYRGGRSTSTQARPGPRQRPRDNGLEHVPLHPAGVDPFRQAPDPAMQHPEPTDLGRLLRALVEHLHPDADAQEGPVGHDGVVRPPGSKMARNYLMHPARRSPTPGRTMPSDRHRDQLGVGGQAGSGPDVLEGLLSRPQVADAVGRARR